MSIRRILTTAAFCAAAVLALSSAPALAAPTVSYAALGDSYSSGVGTGDYYASSGDCYRSPEAYPALWAAANHVTAFDFAACSGATTSDVIASQLGGLSASTTLVSITIGGNDAGFSSVMETCVLGTDSSCVNAVNTGEAYAENVLPAKLATTYADIRARAPHATVIVLGYPDLIQTGTVCLNLALLPMDDTKRRAVDTGANTLDSVISTAAARFSGFQYVDVRAAFAQHEICSYHEWWLHGVELLDIDESFHPTTDGQRLGYLPRLTVATD